MDAGSVDFGCRHGARNDVPVGGLEPDVAGGGTDQVALAAQPTQPV